MYCALGTNSSQTAPKEIVPKKADLSCGNQGLAYAIYPNKREDGTDIAFDAPDYSNFDPVVFKTAAPQVTGTTKSIGFPNTNNIYGNTPADSGYVVVNHKGYLFAEQSGEYTFTISACDNMALLWIGPNAFTDYSRSTANIVQQWVDASQRPVEYKITLTQGQYYPLRLLYGNGGGPGNLQFKIQAPDGKAILDEKTTDSPALVQFSCDGVLAPKFADFGAELAAPSSLGPSEGCPGVHKQLRNVDGKLYKIHCGEYTTPGNEIRSDQRSLVDCLKACTAESRCKQIDFQGPGNDSRI